MSKPNDLWIPVFASLDENAKTKKLAHRLRLPAVWIAGQLVALWKWTVVHRPSGIFERSEAHLIWDAMGFGRVVEWVSTILGFVNRVADIKKRWPTVGPAIPDADRLVDILLDERWLDVMKGGKDGTRVSIHEWPVYVGLLNSVKKAREAAGANDPPPPGQKGTPIDERSTTDAGIDVPPIDPPSPLTVDSRPKTVDRGDPETAPPAPPSASHRKTSTEKIPPPIYPRTSSAVETIVAQLRIAKVKGAPAQLEAHVSAWLERFSLTQIVNQLGAYKINGLDILTISDTAFPDPKKAPRTVGQSTAYHQAPTQAERAEIDKNLGKLDPDATKRILSAINDATPAAAAHALEMSGSGMPPEVRAAYERRAKGETVVVPT